MPQFDNQAFNPFFSNIRQNMELSHGPIRERFPIRLPPKCNVEPNGTFQPPSWLQATVGEGGAQLLAETYEVIHTKHKWMIKHLPIEN
jgi:protein-tyrosine phosphatase